MVAGVRCSNQVPPEALAEFRLLLELAAVRGLADRGLFGPELALVNRLADATIRAARFRDVAGYRQADAAFHLCLLELTGDPVLSDIAQLLLVAHRGCAGQSEKSDPFWLREAGEHRELAGLIADGMVSAADQLLRLHLSRRSADQLAPGCVAEVEPMSFARG